MTGVPCCPPCPPLSLPMLTPTRAFLVLVALQGDQSKQEAAQQYASDKGVELDKGPGTD